ncbi:MAG: hypothetical protein M3404_02400 [Actinomycetota bacterium]|nr:hypothetical protein [Actinomycetota bacterium]
MSTVIKLSDVGRASMKLDRWYRQLLATGNGDPRELAEAQAQLRKLPSQPGSLGRAVALVTAGGIGASDSEMIAAIELLCQAAARGIPPRRSRRPRTRRRDQADVVQLVLPGLERLGGPRAACSLGRR